MKPGATGLTVAAPIWKQVMTQSHDFLKDSQPIEGQPAFDEVEYGKAATTIQKINQYTNAVATDTTKPEWAIDEIFARYNVPIELDNFMSLTAEQQQQAFTSIRADIPTWEAPVQVWLDEHPEFFESLGIQKENPETIDYANWYQERNRLFSEKNYDLYADDLKNITEGSSFTVQYPLFNEKIPVNSIFAASITPDKTGSIKQVEYAINGRSVAVARTAPFTAFVSTERLQPGKANFVIRAWDQADKKTQVVIPIEWTREKMAANQTPLLGQIDNADDHIGVSVTFGGRKKMEAIRLVARKNQRVIYEESIRNPLKSTQFIIQKSTNGRITLDLYATENRKKETLVSTKTVEF